MPDVILQHKSTFFIFLITSTSACILSSEFRQLPVTSLCCFVALLFSLVVSHSFPTGLVVSTYLPSKTVDRKSKNKSFLIVQFSPLWVSFRLSFCFLAFLFFHSNFPPKPYSFLEAFNQDFVCFRAFFPAIGSSVNMVSFFPVVFFFRFFLFFRFTVQPQLPPSLRFLEWHGRPQKRENEL